MANGQEPSSTGSLSFGNTIAPNFHLAAKEGIEFLKFILRCARGDTTPPKGIDWGKVVPEDVATRIRNELRAKGVSEKEDLPSWVRELDPDSPEFISVFFSALLADSIKSGNFKVDMPEGHLIFKLNAWVVVLEWLATGNDDICDDFEKPNPRWPDSIQQVYYLAEVCLTYMFWLPVWLQAAAKSKLATEPGVVALFSGDLREKLVSAVQRLGVLQARGSSLLQDLEAAMLSVTKGVVNIGRQYGQNWHDVVFKAAGALLDAIWLAANPSDYYINALKRTRETPNPSDVVENLQAVAESAMRHVNELEKAGLVWNMVEAQLRAEAAVVAERLAESASASDAAAPSLSLPFERAASGGEPEVRGAPAVSHGAAQAGAGWKGERMSQHVGALEQLLKALECFLDSGHQSEGSSSQESYTSMVPDEVLWESVEAGGDIHNAVIGIQSFYGGKLPAPEARNPWRDLQKTCRHEPDAYERQNKAHHHAGELKRWVIEELVRRRGNASGEETEPAAKGDGGQPLEKGTESPVTEARDEREQTAGPQSSTRPEEPSGPGGINGDDLKLDHGAVRQRVHGQVFISYSHKDQRWLDDLRTHLAPFLRDGSMTAWSDQQITTGSKWLSEIQAALARTSVAVLLVTPNFLASDFIHEQELAPILKEAERGGVRIVWIPIRACAFTKTSLKDYKAVIAPEKPLATMKANRDEAWVKICQEIEKAVRQE